ncbi:LysE family translocator [Comamonas sp. Tr-654]|uniref:LysE family translocator n=1 Tax=Comamonas sp. Tr-654 TaxID=2608341 RepID=UPI001422BA22|nr:LysE family translocator [Comamonas sp. Tr-654]
MLDFSAVMSAAIVCVAGVISPGPNFVAVTHRAVSSSRFEAIAMVFGIALINMLWAAAAVFGVGLLVTSLPWMFWTIKLMGAGYLIWFGIQLLIRSAQPLGIGNTSKTKTTFSAALRAGITTNLANPKSMAFYASMFSGTIPAQASTETLIMLVAMVGTIAVIWYGSVALALSVKRMANLYRQGKSAIERTCGLILILLGCRQGLL